MNLYKNNRKKGYTLAEVLITVTILLILMAIAVPAIFSIRKNLRQKALDNKAELIYTAVQNNLVKLQNNGNSALYASSKATPMGITPADADEEKKLYYVKSSEKSDQNNAASILMTEDTVDPDLYGHYWVVEYNPESASVYAVFYSETKDKYTPQSYDELRYKENRLAAGAWVGYYGGDALDSSNTSTLAPKITVKNEEKLVASITCMRQDSKPLSFEVTLTDAEKNSLTLEYKLSADKRSLVHDQDDLHSAATSTMDPNESSSIVGKKYNLDITLDDLSDTTKRFNALYGTGNTKLSNTKTPLTAGTALTIKVTVRSESSRVDGKYSEVTTNSLFADSSTADKAVLMYGRHLQNLDQNSGVTSKITKAVQESNIHFEAQEDKEDGDTTSWYSCYKDLAFVPITNTTLQSYTGSGNTVIYHLTVEKASEFKDSNDKKKLGAGLFSVLNHGMRVESVRLSGTSIKITNEQNVSAGAIAGETFGNVTVSNCQVFLADEDVEGKTEKEPWISGAKIQGGLVGKTIDQNDEKVVIEDSFAATVMDGSNVSDSIVGGLIGEAEGNIEINRCYADSYLSGTITGGLIACNIFSSDTKIYSCYTAGYLNASSIAGGMIAQATTGTTLENSYIAITFIHSDEQDSSTDSVKRYAVVSEAKNVNNVYYLNDGDVLETGKYFGKQIGYKSLSNRSEMVKKLGNDYVASTTTHPYNLKNQGLSSYSYPSLKNMQHYGDWQASYEAGSLVYYEKYADNTIRNVGFFGGNVIPTLLDDQTILGDGYGIVFKEGEEPSECFEVECQTGSTESNLESFSIDPANCTPYTVTVEGNNYVIYPLPSTLINGKPLLETFYQKLIIKGEAAVGGGTGEQAAQADDVIDGKTFYFNPHFAKTVESSDTVPENPTRIAIRTVRQLYHLSLYYSDYAESTKKSTFLQETDIDYTSEYEWKEFATVDKVSVQSPIGIKDGKVTAFGATYNGNYHEIRGISFETGANKVGFIGENNGVVQNVFLAGDWNTTEEVSNLYVNYSGTIGNNRKVYMGTLIGINKGRIQNCAVSGYQIGKNGVVYVQRNGTAYMGGMVGSNQGSILNCEAEAPSIKANVLYGSAYLGGFAGENASAGTIRKSYAVGNGAVTFARGSNSVIGGFTAHNAGILSSDYCAVAMTAAGSTSTYGFAPKGTGVISSDCYYLSGGTFKYIGEMHPFDNDNQRDGGTSISYKELSEQSKNSKAAVSKCHQLTDESDYPFAAVVSNSSGKVHYGNWQIPLNLGSMGVIYWELEEDGANNGYHFSYIGYTQDAESPNDTLHRTSGSTLCQQHDDGGKIRQYGYGYYYADTSDDAQKPVKKETKGFLLGDKNEEASSALSARLDGFTVIAYTTEPAIGGTQGKGNYMKMNSADRQANGQWSFTYNEQEYAFTINPFFANAMQYGVDDGTLRIAGISAVGVNVVDENGFESVGDSYDPMPGTADNEYEIRSDDQLQYLNWNYDTKNAYTMLGGENYSKETDKYTYLGYACKEKNYKWRGKGSPERVKITSSGWNNWCNAYTNIDTKSTDYWDFIEDPNGEVYEVTTWSSSPCKWWHSHWESSVTEKTGYWQWIGDGEPLDANGNKLNAKDYTNAKSYNVNYCWLQTHDIDAEMWNTSEWKFTQIGSMYDEFGQYNREEASAYMSYFSGHYDGNTYYIKNVEIDSKNTVVGLFGSIIGADVQNIILYSENNNCIQRNESSPKSWYAIGGLCGLAAVGQNRDPANVKIKNCTVSGYTIRDNSTNSSWGDGNVGGMFGMCTIDLARCTAVNTIDINCAFNKSKSDGVSVRIGGLVGSMRGNITSCYTGGEIKCEQRTITDAGLPVGGTTSTKLFLGGITGGIYIKNAGNLTELIGGPIQGLTDWSTRHDNSKCTTPTTVISNSYTYIKMPEDIVNVVKSVEPIGSNAETPHENAYNHHVWVKISNCYYYKDYISESLLKKQFTVNNVWGGDRYWTNIGTSWAGIYPNNTGATPISWDELANKKTVGETGEYLLNLLNRENQEPFEQVTIMENGQSVDGKYSFPGNRADLDGENFPFPTVLQQKYGSGHVNVHYGAWPLEGIYWKESRATMDIYEDLITDHNDANYGAARKDFYLEQSRDVLGNDKKLGTGDSDFQVEYSSGASDAETAIFTDGSEQETFLDAIDEEPDGFSSETEVAENMSDMDETSRILNPDEYIAEVVEIQYNTEKKCYVASVKALKTGTTVITVKTTGTDNQPYRASFTLTVTADLTVYASPETVEQKVNESTDVTLFAVPTAMLGGSNTVGVSDDSMAVVGSDGFTAEESMEEAFASEEVYANGTPEPEKDLASLFTWEVKTGEGQEGAVTLSPIVNNKFKVTSEAEIPVTLIITGTFIYEGSTYTSMTWVDVKTTEAKEIKWENSTAELTLLAPDDSGIVQEPLNIANYNLNVPTSCISDGALTVANFTVTPLSDTASQEDSVLPIAEVKTITAPTEGNTVYKIGIQANRAGIAKITVNVTSPDGSDCYSDSFVLTVKAPTAEEEPTDTTEGTNPSNSGWDEPSNDNTGFDQNEMAGWKDNANEYVDIVPNDSSTADNSGWESGE